MQSLLLDAQTFKLSGPPPPTAHAEKPLFRRVRSNAGLGRLLLLDMPTRCEIYKGCHLTQTMLELFATLGPTSHDLIARMMQLKYTSGTQLTDVQSGPLRFTPNEYNNSDAGEQREKGRQMSCTSFDIPTHGRTNLGPSADVPRHDIPQNTSFA